MHWGQWALVLPPPPPHIVGCDGTEPYGETCAACRLLEIQAWDRWVTLFRWVPSDQWGRQGMGYG